MRFEWDPAKSAKNESERAISFAYAATVFGDEARIDGFSRQVRGEDRYYVIGRTVVREIPYVVYTWRFYENEKVCRIISARKASAVERRRFAQLH